MTWRKTYQSTSTRPNNSFHAAGRFNISFPLDKILVLGATSGIGRGLSEKFLAEGRSIIVVGRRKDQLSDFIAKHPAESERISAYAFDVTKLEEIPAWVAKYGPRRYKENINRVSSEHPDLEAVFVNACIHHAFDFSKPETTFLPFLIAQNKPTTLTYTTSGLAIVPLGLSPGYCATKAALHHFLLPTELRDDAAQSKWKQHRYRNAMKDFVEET
ncbi:hypothetical protein FN846DRAFT_909295 [Sphaerosporella brunnea]|uniref:Short-chain dehydrogenase n=1 Tax=Sphaerosporella brunnea TaxID=1250544 RepID=A0A5J5EQY0_9PEZI|nr:hypothetical protein FN846DRAFT_909295 [Sphaerosporella brunnea]